MRQALSHFFTAHTARAALGAILGSLLTAALAGCQSGRPAPPEVVAADQVQVGIADSETQWNADLAQRDPAKVAAHYAETATLMAPGLAAPVHGRAAIQAVLAQWLADPNFSLTFHKDAVSASVDGNLAYTRGPFTETFSAPGTGAKVTLSGTYLRIYQPEGQGSGPAATWAAVEDIAVAGAPSAAPQTGGGA